MSLEDADRQWLTNALTQVDFMVYHSPEEISRILDDIERIEVPSGTTIVQQGQDRSDFFIIGQGAVSIWTEKSAGRQHLANLGQGEYFGEMSLITGSRCNADVVAEEDTVVYRILPDNFYDIIRKNNTLADHISRAVAKRRQERQDLLGVDENVDPEEQYKKVKNTLMHLVGGEEI